MTTPMCEDGGLLREWVPLTKLLQQIPLKSQNGLFTQDVNFTCIDAVTEFIAIGTNHGLVYWYDREKGDLQRLRCENTNTSITCVRVISTVDYMVAAGNDQGIVTVFQIPKNPPDSLPDSLKPKQKKQVERYNIGGLHKKAVTTVEWSKNGMKLFSGDQDGLVVITEIDFYMHLSKSSELLNEKYPVVQLSYQQGLLLVSTVFRTILVNRNQNDKVSQVGQKERKMLGKLGACFGPRQSPFQEPVIYCSRPGVRLWQADKHGTVLKTLIFKDALQTGYTEVELLNPVSENTKKSRGEPTLGIILPFCEDLLVTYSDDVVYVINPINVGITSAVTDLRRVTSVACNKDELFILEGDRNIIRVAYHPETDTLLSVPEVETTTDPLPSLAEISKPIAAGIMELTSKFKESSIVPAIPLLKINPSNLIQSISIMPTITVGTDTTTVTKGEEAIEIPHIPPLGVEMNLITEVTEEPATTDFESGNRNDIIQKKTQDERWRIFQKIGEQEFEDIVFTPERKNKKFIRSCLNGNENRVTTTDCMNSSTEPTVFDKMPLKSNQVEPIKSSPFTVYHDINLELGTKNLLCDTIAIPGTEQPPAAFHCDDENASPLENLADSENFNGIRVEIDCTVSSNESLNHIITDYNDNPDTESIDEEDESYTTELKKLQDLGECTKQLLQQKSNQSHKTHGIDEVDFNSGSSAHKERNHELESQFNALSKEFITLSSIEEEDWVLV
ncbi:WD repeat-containing protein CG11141 isoform X1 [Neodiprion pinetum]|uniref:WD repeat-containing protein CG11141 isoform X1 n=1 Tax=Neodiprion lecontei TaxID=441921 RepID=A0A6J0BUL4_NEOLC|nr:WD repeat-containing protein CG11141 isoform X1 [Neodiprion lecontei]XP_046489745.1 WD repeat-containing protein CG11141 isoform X1 [Neodiprion pinetum]XP_046489746.1 WD repeat-containing protein CG11141 isoform X1 [Neodiprion pinetum]XP_046600843.1 WD repeat-containing protein CG11141 isoform X1 [Neodiprion lecontei]